MTALEGLLTQILHKIEDLDKKVEEIRNPTLLVKEEQLMSDVTTAFACGDKKQIKEALKRFNTRGEARR